MKVLNAGITKAQTSRIIYNALKQFQKELREHNIHANYESKNLTGKDFIVNFFQVGSKLYPTLSIRRNSVGMDEYPNLSGTKTFADGVQRLFAAQAIADMNAEINRKLESIR